uniref:Uncharacterized protein n=1 Tax=Peronospora matthiolae TaxID=2874970 RepID=A0AAV1TDL7_9STRA
MNLSEAQQITLMKIKAIIGQEQVALVMAQGPDGLRACLLAFSSFESMLIGQVHDHLTSAMPAQ